MGRDGDEFLTIALLDPRSHRLDRVSQRIGADCLEARVQSEPLERSPGREDQARLAALLALQDLGRRDPRGARAFAGDDAAAANRPAGMTRDEEQGVEPPHRMEFRAPSGRTASVCRIDLQPVF